ncbi:MAG: ATP/GTP-binding protein [bacterium]|nr:ATP/GTP-binding protein [bacterium]
MAEIKIVITGAVGSGKTTAIQAISEIPVIATEVDASDEVREQKETTTVAMDYGELSLDDGNVLKIYGTPGQKRFSFMWEILAEGALGFVILVNNQRSSPLDDLAMYLENFEIYIKESTVVVGVTHVDEEQCGMEKYHDYMINQGLSYPIFPIDARSPSDVKVMIEAMAAMMNG